MMMKVWDESDEWRLSVGRGRVHVSHENVRFNQIKIETTPTTIKNEKNTDNGETIGIQCILDDADEHKIKIVWNSSISPIKIA